MDIAWRITVSRLWHDYIWKNPSYYKPVMNAALQPKCTEIWAAAAAIISGTQTLSGLVTFYICFVSTWYKSPIWPHALWFKAHFNHNHTVPAVFPKYSTWWLMWAASHFHTTLALRTNIWSQSLINNLEDHQYLSFTIQILIFYCIGKYIIAKHT